MIYKDTENPDLTIVEFGHGSVKVCATNNPDTKIANGVVLVHDDNPKPLGTENPQDIGKDVREFNNAVLLLFRQVESIDILIGDLMAVRRGMIRGVSVGAKNGTGLRLKTLFRK